MKYLLFFLLLSASAFSTPLEEVWSNRETHISEIINTGISTTGDSLIIIENNFINFYNTTDYSLISRIFLNTFSKTSYYGINTRITNNIFFRFPYIISGINNFDLGNYQLSNLMEGSGYSKNYDYLKERDILTITYEYNDFYYKADMTTYTVVAKYEISKKEVKEIFRFSSVHNKAYVYDAAFINDNEYLMARSDGLGIYYINSKRFVVLDSSFKSSQTKHCRMNNKIYFFGGNDKYIEYDVNNGNYSLNYLNLMFLNDLDSGKVLSKNSFVNKPGEIVAKYSYQKKNSNNEIIQMYGFACVDINENKLKFNVEIVNDATLVGYDSSFIHVRITDPTPNIIGETQEIFQKINIQNGEVLCERKFYKTFRKVANLMNNNIIRINNHKIENIDKSNGTVSRIDEYNDGIKSVFMMPNLNDYVVISQNDKIISAGNSNISDYHLISHPLTDIKISPNHNYILIFGHSKIFVMDARTTRLKDVIWSTSDRAEFLTDSTFLCSSLGWPKTYNINTNKFIENTIGFRGQKIVQTNRDGIVLSVESGLIQKVPLNNPSLYSTIYYNNLTSQYIYNAALSDDDKYLCIIREIYESNKPELQIINKDNDQIVYVDHPSDNEMLIDLLFFKSQNKIAYTKINYEKGICKLIIYDIDQKKELVSKEFGVHKLVNFKTTKFWKSYVNLQHYDNNLLILQNTMNGSLVLDTKDLSIKSSTDMTKHLQEYNDLGFSNYELIMTLNLWKINHTFSFQLNSYNPPKPLLILTQNLEDNSLHRRFFNATYHLVFKYNKSDLFGYLYNDRLYDIDYINSTFIPKQKVEKQVFNAKSRISSDDINLTHYDYAKFYSINLSTGKNYPKSPNIGFDGDYVFDNNTFIQVADNNMFVTDVRTGKFIDTLTAKSKLFTAYPMQYITHKDGLLFSAHDDGIIRLWKRWMPEPIYEINVGSSVREMYFVDNYEKLYVNTLSGFHYLFNIKDFVISDVENKIESNNNQLIYPNPADDYIIISLPSIKNSNHTLKGVVENGQVKVQIFNTLGIEVSSAGLGVKEVDGDGYRIDISNLPTGVYFIKIGNYSEKFMVVR